MRENFRLRQENVELRKECESLPSGPLKVIHPDDRLAVACGCSAEGCKRPRLVNGGEQRSSDKRLPLNKLMEARMRRYFALSAVSCTLASAMLISVAAAASLDEPYIYRRTSGSWTNVEYNDGVCHYYYAYNSYDQTMKLDRYGDCSHVAIGPDGVAMRISREPVFVGQIRR